MSTIDQAFIQAYSSEAPGAVPTGQRSIASESIPAPHFPVTSPEEMHWQAARMQQATAEQTPVQGVDVPDSERRPLSNFTSKPTETVATFRPVFEVDGFRWPEVTRLLLSQHAPLLTPVAHQLLDSGEAGRSIVAIAGCRSGVGTTSVLLCLSRLLAAAEKEIALVDADFSHSALASQLGLQVDTGWEDVLAGRVPLAEGVVHSINDRISLLPLTGSGESVNQLLDGIQTSISAGVLRYHYDLVLFDLGSIDSAVQRTAAKRIIEQCRIDASIIVADSQHCEQRPDNNIDPLMSLLGNTCLGVIGNTSAR